MVRYNIKKIIILILIFSCLNKLISQDDALPLNIQNIIKTAFTKKTPRETSLFIENEIKKLGSNKEKRIALSSLADYEERFDLFSRAGKHYIEAANFSPQTEKKILLTKAFSSFLLADNITEASGLCHNILLPMMKEPFTKEDIKILVFFEWLKLKSQENISLENIKKYVTDSKFREYHPALLLTLWWVDNDKKAENTLLKKFPNSVEAGILKGDAILSPKTFWYLMPRNFSQQESLQESLQESENEDISSEQSDVLMQNIESSSAKLFQTGFFKTENFAKGLSEELQKKGFRVVIKKEQRGSDFFYSVLVKDDGMGDILIRLKSEGYEAVPIFD